MECTYGTPVHSISHRTPVVLTLLSELLRKEEKPMETDAVKTGTAPGEGKYVCLKCGEYVHVKEAEELPKCPTCGEDSYTKV
jgi:rubrerythrin